MIVSPPDQVLKNNNLEPEMDHLRNGITSIEILNEMIVDNASHNGL